MKNSIIKIKTIIFLIIKSKKYYYINTLYANLSFGQLCPAVICPMCPFFLKLKMKRLSISHTIVRWVWK